MYIEHDEEVTINVYGHGEMTLDEITKANGQRLIAKDALNRYVLTEDLLNLVIDEHLTSMIELVPLRAFEKERVVVAPYQEGKE